MDKLETALNSKFLNNQDKKPLLKNYFFVGTIIQIIVLLAITFIIGLGAGQTRGLVKTDPWYLWVFNMIVSNYYHSGVTHIVLNTVAATCLGYIIERRVGSLKYFGLIIGSIFFSSLFLSLMRKSPEWYGYSVVNYFQYTWAFYIFALTCIHFKENKIDFFADLIPLLFLFGSMFYPFTPGRTIDLIRTSGHWFPLLVGLGFLVINLGYYHSRKYILKK